MAPLEVPAMAKRRRRASRARKPGPVRARAFELVDDDGQVIARLGRVPGADVSELGVGLVVLGPSGDIELALTVDSSGPAIHLSSDGIVRLTLAVLRSDDSSSTVLIAARDGRGEEVLAATIGDG
jgi:hypothetical protein